MRRFWAKVDKTPGHGPHGECWRWTARVDGRGYGEIKVAGHYKKAHRLALFGVGDLDNPLFACHRCDNPACVRASHLFPGKPIDNVMDMRAKGRGPNARKLREKQVIEIRSSPLTGAELARQYLVDPMTVSRIRSGKIYTEPNYFPRKV